MVLLILAVESWRSVSRTGPGLCARAATLPAPASNAIREIRNRARIDSWTYADATPWGRIQFYEPGEAFQANPYARKPLCQPCVTPLGQTKSAPRPVIMALKSSPATHRTPWARVETLEPFHVQLRRGSPARKIASRAMALLGMPGEPRRRNWRNPSRRNYCLKKILIIICCRRGSRPRLSVLTVIRAQAGYTKVLIVPSRSRTWSRSLAPRPNQPKPMSTLAPMPWAASPAFT